MSTIPVILDKNFELDYEPNSNEILGDGTVKSVGGGTILKVSTSSIIWSDPINDISKFPRSQKILGIQSINAGS